MYVSFSYDLPNETLQLSRIGCLKVPSTLKIDTFFVQDHNQKYYKHMYFLIFYLVVVRDRIVQRKISGSTAPNPTFEYKMSFFLRNYSKRKFDCDKM
jgi:hypothetical protein